MNAERNDNDNDAELRELAAKVKHLTAIVSQATSRVATFSGRVAQLEALQADCQATRDGLADARKLASASAHDGTVMIDAGTTATASTRASVADTQRVATDWHAVAGALTNIVAELRVFSESVATHKQSNPAVSDDLVSVVQQAVTDANRAIVATIEAQTTADTALSGVHLAYASVNSTTALARRVLVPVQQLAQRIGVEDDHARARLDAAAAATHAAQLELDHAQSQLADASKKLESAKAALAAAEAGLG